MSDRLYMYEEMRSGFFHQQLRATVFHSLHTGTPQVLQDGVHGQLAYSNTL